MSNTRRCVNCHIRWITRKDMQNVLACEEAAYGVDSWSEEDFTRCLRQRNCIGMFAEQGDVSWATWSTNYTRRTCMC